MAVEEAGVRGTSNTDGLIRALWQCVRNDPFELCWECSSEVMGQAQANSGQRGTFRQLLGGMVYVLRLAIRSGKPETWDRSIDGKFFFFAKTHNQAHAVQAIAELLGQEAVKSDAEFLNWLLRRAALFSLPFLPVLLFRCLAATAYQRGTLPRCVSDYWLSYGIFLASFVLLQSRPAALVVSNDHTVIPRSMTRAANFKGIPTAFIPHAGVIDGLPPLGFDIAFLDGIAAAQKYWGFGPSPTGIFLAGNCRLDSVLQKPRPCRGTILFCPGFRDDSAAMLRLLSAMILAVPAASVTLRPHPREPARQRYLDAAKGLGCQFSDAREERAEAALGRVDVVVSGDSNIILEAKLARRWVAVFAPTGKISDHYGYLAEGIPDAVCREAVELIEFLRTAQSADPPAWDGIWKYMATAGTNWEGRSAELIAATLRDLARTGAPPVFWEPIDAPSQQPVFVPRPG